MKVKTPSPVRVQEGAERPKLAEINQNQKLSWRVASKNETMWQEVSVRRAAYRGECTGGGG